MYLKGKVVFFIYNGYTDGNNSWIDLTPTKACATNRRLFNSKQVVMAYNKSDRMQVILSNSLS